MSYLRLFRSVLSVVAVLASATALAGGLPTLTGIQPAGANVAGGNSVLLTGVNLSAITSVTFDGLPATILRQDANSLYVTAPAHAAGAVTVNAYVADRAISGAPSLAFTYADDHDASRDFSAVQNPAGAWTYGVAPTEGQAITVATGTTIDGCVDTWSATDFFPVIGRNRTGTTCNQYTWSWPAGMIGIHPDNTAEFGVIRFTVPQAGRYEIDGLFLCIDYVVACTIDVSIRHNLSNVLFQSPMNQGGVPKPFGLVLDLNLGDTIDFGQGNGGNGLPYDQVVLDAHVRPALFGDGFEELN